VIREKIEAVRNEQAKLPLLVRTQGKGFFDAVVNVLEELAKRAGQ
jgi:hypothetical protein